jgi:hypothetical protein
MDRRSQTPADYLIGISLLLVTIFGVFAFVPTVFDPFEEPTSPDEHVMADRLAADLVDNHTMHVAERTVDLDSLDAALGSDVADVQAWAGIPDWKQVNVTVKHGQSRVVWEGDEWRGDRPGGMSVRRIVSHQEACRDGCNLVVRVWGR